MSDGVEIIAREMEALLAFYDACGVDCAVGEAPVDRFRQPLVETLRDNPIARAEPSTPLKQLAPAATPASPDAVVREAARLAAAATTLDELREALEGFRGLESLVRARQFLFSKGAPSDLMIMDYAPGETEERSGEAFSGAEARLLAAMLRAAGASSDAAYLSYFTPWRTPGGQPLAPHVAAALVPFARRHVALARPKRLLMFGDVAKLVLDATETPTSLYGRSLGANFDGVAVTAFSAPTPSAALRIGALKRGAWRSLRKLAASMSS